MHKKRYRKTVGGEKLKKYISLLSIAVCIALSGCSISNLGDPTDKPIKQPDEIKAHEGLASIFPSEPNKKEIRYQGMAEYGHVQLLDRVYEVDGTRYINYKGWMEDGLGGEPEERKFYIDYYIDHKQVTEGIKNLDIMQPNSTNRLKSIIPHQIVLQAPLELNHSWTQEFDYEPVEEHDHKGKHQVLTATHTITKINNNNGKPIFTVETVVKDIDGYYNNTYKEVKTWEVGKGLTSFSQSIPIYDGFEGNEKDAENLLIFGYGLAK